MKTTKLVTGILMIILSVLIAFQSMAVGVSDAIASNGHSSGSMGILVGILYLAAGIIYLSTRKSEKMGGDVANLIILVIAFVIGISDVGIYSDLKIWSWLALIIGVGFFIWHKISNKKVTNATTK